MIGTDFRDRLRACGPDVTTVACSSGGATKEFMSNEPRLLDLLAAALMVTVICRGKPSGSVFVNTNVVSWGGWAFRRIRPSFGPSCQDGGEGFHRQDGRVYNVVPRSDADELCQGEKFEPRCDAESDEAC